MESTLAYFQLQKRKPPLQLHTLKVKSCEEWPSTFRLPPPPPPPPHLIKQKETGMSSGERPTLLLQY